MKLAVPHTHNSACISSIAMVAAVILCGRAAIAGDADYGNPSPALTFGVHSYGTTDETQAKTNESSTTSAEYYRTQDKANSIQTVSHEVSCDTCDSGQPCECDSAWYDNLSIFGGLDGSKQPQDFGVNAQFGGRFHINLGLPLWEEQGLGVQIGTALNYTDNAVQVFERVDGTKDRFQNYTTVGLFQRTESGFMWAIGYDFLYQDYYDDFNLGQWRGDVGYTWDDENEFGTWFTISNQKDSGHYLTIPLTLDPITQGNLYWRRTWENDAQTTFWLGIAEGHGEVNLALGDLRPTKERLVFGADVFVPLSPYLALFGQANFITPADSGTVDAFLGIAFYPGGSHGARNRRFAPRLPVANNTTFATDLSR
ncbi:DUF6666 family protein [Symmachiella dynata]|nr:DUF6666 family protein [Symmachiella dynata]